MTQILPVLVALAMARRHREGWATIVAIEEPESHLHPDTQRALAEHLCRVAAEPDPPAIVLETHSNALVLAVQLAIARGDIAPERVCAYWVDAYDDGTSLAKPAEFDEHGNPDGNWPAQYLRRRARVGPRARHLPTGDLTGDLSVASHHRTACVSPRRCICAEASGDR